MNDFIVGKKSGISYLRIFATVCVVFIHTCSTLTDNLELFSLTVYQKIFFSAAYQSMYWAVPAFFMITGSLLLERTICYKDILFKYVKKIVIILLVFGTTFSFIKQFAQNKTFSIVLIKNTLFSVLEDTGFGHLWYLYVLIGLYLLLPVFNLISKLEKEEIEKLLLVLFLFDFCAPLISNLTGVKIAFSIPATYPVFYYVLGYYLSRFSTINNKISCLMIMIGELIIISSNILGFYTKSISSYSSPIIVIIAIGIFCLFKNLDYKNLNYRIWMLDRLCLGVYIIHPLFIHIVYRLIKINPSQFKNYFVSTILFFGAFTVLSFFSSFIMSRITFIKKLII